MVRGSGVPGMVLGYPAVMKALDTLLDG